jgi:hypothetical protein
MKFDLVSGLKDNTGKDIAYIMVLLCSSQCNMKNITLTLIERYRNKKQQTCHTGCVKSRSNTNFALACVQFCKLRPTNNEYFKYSNSVHFTYCIE